MKLGIARRYFHQLLVGVSFGLTTAVITTLGMIVGLYVATSSRLAVVAGIVVMAIADGLSDAVSIHTVEEAETEMGFAKHTEKEIWLTTLFTFLSVCGFTLSFAIPILLLELELAIHAAICWGMALLVSLNFFIARIRRERPFKLILEHLALAGFVILISHRVGGLVRLVG
jgi:VIT1/CCC1 family predicted Fe2+/Mn2+ transporter